MLSKIETGRIAPPVATLTKIAAALGVRVSALLDGDEANATVLDAVRLVDQGPRVCTDVGYTFYPFAGRRPSKLMEPFLFIARRGEIKTHRLSHVGEEFLYVLKRRLRNHIRGLLVGQGGQGIYERAKASRPETRARVRIFWARGRMSESLW